MRRPGRLPRAVIQKLEATRPPAKAMQKAPAMQKAGTPATHVEGNFTQDALNARNNIGSTDINT